MDSRIKKKYLLCPSCSFVSFTYLYFFKLFIEFDCNGLTILGPIANMFVYLADNTVVWLSSLHWKPSSDMKQVIQGCDLINFK